MPFKSEAQRKYLFANHPRIARRWAKETSMPEKTRYKNETPSEFRQRMRKKASGLDVSQLRKRAKNAPESKAKIFAKALENARLRKAKPDWRKKAGGGNELFSRLREARVSEDPKAGTQLARLETRATAFKDKRAKMLERLRARKQKKVSVPEATDPRRGS